MEYLWDLLDWTREQRANGKKPPCTGHARGYDEVIIEVFGLGVPIGSH